MTDRCGAHARTTGKPCRNPAGFRTDHLGHGRCFMHGGSSPIIHGQRATLPVRYRLEGNPTLASIAAEHAAHPDPYSMDDELALLRGLLHQRLERRKGPCPMCERPSDEDLSPALIEMISRVIARIEKIKSADAISRAGFMGFVQKMALTVQYEVDDETMERIRERWQDLTVEAP